jgi:hypothetical protein
MDDSVLAPATVGLAMAVVKSKPPHISIDGSFLLPPAN